jgi:Uma2 family endonuclease
MGLSLKGLTLPVRILPGAPLSDDKFLAFARANEPYRLERNPQGEVIVMTPVGRRGGRREVYLIVELEEWAESDGRGEVDGSNTGWNLPDGWTLSPDASWTFSERLQPFSDEEQEKFLPLCPDFIAEVRSQSDVLSVVMEKMERWTANGAQLGWLIDPYATTVYIYRPGRQPETLHKPEVLKGEGRISVGDGATLGLDSAGRPSLMRPLLLRSKVYRRIALGCLLLGLLHIVPMAVAKDVHQWKTGTLLAITDSSSDRIVGNSHTGSVQTVTDVEYRLSILLDGMTYVGSYWPRWKWSYTPADLVVNDHIEISIDGKEMFIKRPDGQELKTKIIQRIRQSDNPKAEVPVSK